MTVESAPNITLDGAILAGQVFLAGVVISFVVRWLVQRLLLWRNRGQSAAVNSGRPLSATA